MNRKPINGCGHRHGGGIQSKIQHIFFTYHFDAYLQLFIFDVAYSCFHYMSFNLTSNG